jgi:hypothetical protein
LLSFIVSQDLSVFGQYVGVNKPCCGGCYDTLRSVKMKCAEPRGKDFTNWLEPGKIETKVMDKRGF